MWTGSFGGTITIGLTTLNYYYGVSVAPFNGVMSLIYSGCAGSGVPCSGSLFYSTTALPTSVTGTFDVAMNGTTDVDPGTFVIADSNTIYVGADATVAGGGLYKFTSIAGTTASYWAPYTFGTNSQVKNPSAASLGVHGLIGRTEGAAYTLYLSTSATTANAVYRYDTSYDSSAVVGAGECKIAIYRPVTMCRCVVADALVSVLAHMSPHTPTLDWHSHHPLQGTCC